MTKTDEELVAAARDLTNVRPSRRGGYDAYDDMILALCDRFEARGGVVNAAAFARAICESEGKEWVGLDNSRADCERWFKAGEACLASLSRREPEGWRETSGDSDDLNTRALRICRREVRKFDERGASLKTDIHAAVKAAMLSATPAPPSPETE